MRSNALRLPDKDPFLEMDLPCLYPRTVRLFLCAAKILYSGR